MSLQSLRETLEAVQQDEAELDLQIGSISNGELGVKINGKEYSYAPMKDSAMDIKQIREKVVAVARHNAGAALSWLRKNAITATGSKRGPVSMAKGTTVKEGKDKNEDIGDSCPKCKKGTLEASFRGGPFKMVCTDADCDYERKPTRDEIAQHKED